MPESDIHGDSKCDDPADSVPPGGTNKENTGDDNLGWNTSGNPVLDSKWTEETSRKEESKCVKWDSRDSGQVHEQSKLDTWDSRDSDQVHEQSKPDKWDSRDSVQVHEQSKPDMWDSGQMHEQSKPDMWDSSGSGQIHEQSKPNKWDSRDSGQVHEQSRSDKWDSCDSGQVVEQSKPDKWDSCVSGQVDEQSKPDKWGSWDSGQVCEQSKPDTWGSWGSGQVKTLQGQSWDSAQANSEDKVKNFLTDAHFPISSGHQRDGCMPSHASWRGHNNSLSPRHHCEDRSQRSHSGGPPGFYHEPDLFVDKYPSRRPQIHCRDFSFGRCRRGSECRYLHDSGRRSSDANAHEIGWTSPGLGDKSYGRPRDGTSESWSKRGGGSLGKRPCERRDGGTHTHESWSSHGISKVCKFYAEGRCWLGENCRFLHLDRDHDELETSSHDESSKHGLHIRSRSRGDLFGENPVVVPSHLLHQGLPNWNASNTAPIPQGGTLMHHPPQFAPPGGNPSILSQQVSDNNFSGGIVENGARGAAEFKPIEWGRSSGTSSDAIWHPNTKMRNVNNQILYENAHHAPADNHITANRGGANSSTAQNLEPSCTQQFSSFSVPSQESSLVTPVGLNSHPSTDNQLCLPGTMPHIDPSLQTSAAGPHLGNLSNLSASLAQFFASGQSLPQLCHYADPPSDNLNHKLPFSENVCKPAYDSVNSTRTDGCCQLLELGQSNSVGGAPDLHASNSIVTVNDELHKTVNQTCAEGSLLLNQDDGCSKQVPNAMRHEAFNVNDDTAVTLVERGKEQALLTEGGIQADAREEDMNGDTKIVRALRYALIEHVKELLKPTWKEGRMSKETYKTIVKKAVDKVIGSIQGPSMPQTLEQIDELLSFSEAKISRLVQAYVDKYVRS